MKIRYYLRGLGLGILFTSVFFLLFGNSSKQTMSDEMIKERAKELGMIENMVLVDMGTTTEETIPEFIEESQTEVTEEETNTETELGMTEAASVIVEDDREAESVKEADLEVASEEDFSKAEEVKKTETSFVEDNLETPEEPDEVAEVTGEGRNISIMVNKGDGSDTVSQKLFEAGLVTDPYEYDHYLMENGYDRRISAGEHLIPAGAQWQEMAEILCNLR